MEDKRSESINALFNRFASVTCMCLNVRRRPTMDSEVILIISKNTKVKILSDKTESMYYKILVNGIQGYCMKSFVEEVDNNE